MDKDEILAIIKGTKYGKWAAACLVLAVIGIIEAVTGDMEVGPALSSAVVCIIVAAVLLNIGKKRLSDPQKAAVPAPTFLPTKKVGKYLYVDENNKKFRVPCDKKNNDIYNYSELLDFECVEDGNTVSKGSVLNAAAGALVLGTVGAFVGAGAKKTKVTCHKLQVKISINNMQKPIAYINLLDFEVKKDSNIYKAALQNAEEITAVLSLIKSSNQGE